MSKSGYFLFLSLGFLMIILLTFGVASAQSWISSNAVWHYNYEEVGGVLGYHKIEYVKDTLLLDETCEYLEVVKQAYIPTGPPAWTYVALDPDTLAPRFTFFRNDTVFYYNEGEFSVLYCFSATSGQSWDLGVDTSYFMCSKSVVSVINTGMIYLNGQDWPVLEVISAPGSSVWLYGRIVERFGSYDNYLFPLPQNCDTNIAVEFPNFFFSCFSDDEFPLLQAGNYDCDNPLSVGISEITHSGQKSIVFPNPTTGNTFIRLLDHDPAFSYRLIIVDDLGIERYKIDISSEQTYFDISVYPPGLYHILIYTNNHLTGSMKLIKK